MILAADILENMQSTRNYLSILCISIDTTSDPLDEIISLLFLFIRRINEGLFSAMDSNLIEKTTSHFESVESFSYND